LHRTCCAAISLDELAMLELIGLQQASSTRAAVAAASDLVEVGAIGPLLWAGGGLATALRCLGLIMPCRGHAGRRAGVVH
jgi:hypothetical protein